MAISPFPPQVLAQLVLGYLAEEELMTAHDEFLQASPYLDAFRNEYDRIFMTSLRTILADYRAVKIHVETCKPHSLRKKLLQCTNLFEIVKFLISLIDHHKLYADDLEKPSFQKSSVPKGTCEVCNSKISTTTLHTQSINEEHSTYNKSVQATSLEGNNQDRVTKVPDASTTDMVMPMATQTAKETLISNIKGPPRLIEYQPANNPASPIVQCQNIAGDKSQTHLGNNNKVIGNKIIILSMPTLTVVPTSGPTSSTANNLQNDAKNKIEPTSEVSTVSPKRRPLFIGLPSDNTSVPKDQKPTQMKDVGLVKTVDSVTHASLPKDNTAPSKTSTPHVLPPLKLTEKNTSDDSVIALSDSPVRPTVNMVTDTNNNHTDRNDNPNAHNNSQLNKEQKGNKKRNWDEGLRAFVASTENAYPTSVPKSSRKKKKADNKSTKENDSVIGAKLNKSDLVETPYRHFRIYKWKRLNF